MSTHTTLDQKRKLDLKPLEVGVGAGSAVVTAVATSYLGTAGTLAGAAVASVVGTVSTSVLRSSAQRTNESLQRTTDRLRQLRATGAVGPDGMPTATAAGVDPALEVDPAAVAAENGTLGEDVVETAAAAAATTDPETTTTVPTGSTDTGIPAGTTAGTTTGGGAGDEPIARRRRWPVLAAGTVAAFALALGAITGIEALAGKPLAAVVGNETGSGTTLNGTVRKDPEPAATVPAGSPSSTPSGTTDPSATTEPSPSTSVSPTGEPSATPSPTPEPTATQAPTPTQPDPTGGASPTPLQNSSPTP